MNKSNIKFRDYYNISVDIDTEKRVVYISESLDKNTKGISKRYHNKKDIIRIFSNYIFNKINIYPKYKK